VLAVLGAAPSAHASGTGDDWFGRDKALHFEVSVAMASGTYALASLKLDPMWQRAAIGAGVSLAIGAGKELYDMTGRGDPSWRDFTWDAIGTAVGLGLALAIDAITRGAESHAEPSAASPLGAHAAPLGVHGLVVRF
jgi:putative lipoprotein